MGYLQWKDMLDRHPVGHLVVGVIEGAPARSVDLLGKLLKRMNPKGDYSFHLVKEGGYSVHVVFARQQDADTFVASIGAKKMGKYLGWKSQREFGLDDRVRKAIAAALKSGA